MSGSTLPALVRASHPVPTFAVTALVVALARVAGHAPDSIALIGLAVFCGQLSIGWSNDLIDAHRDRRVGRRDKPVAAGVVPPGTVRIAIAGALLVCVALSLALGWWAAAAHLVAGVGSGWAYNAGLKRTRWSVVPYVVAFGTLPVVVYAAFNPPRLAPWWMVTVAGLLGAGAHLLNALPDLEDDARTAVVGLPHRLGPRRTLVLGVTTLTVASIVLAIARAFPPDGFTWVMLASVAVLAVVAFNGKNATPFYAAIGIATVNVVLLVVTA